MDDTSQAYGASPYPVKDLIPKDILRPCCRRYRQAFSRTLKRGILLSGGISAHRASSYDDYITDLVVPRGPSS